MVGEGLLTLSCAATATIPNIVCDVVPSINDNVSVSVMRTPIVTFKADQAFAFDTGARSSISFSIVRNNPENPNDRSEDSRDWSNARFEREIVRYIDRWQARTDGCQLIFEPYTTGQRMILEPSVYLASLSITANHGVAETFYISLDADIGTMTAKVKPVIRDSVIAGYTQPVQESDFLVMMSSSDATRYYDLYFGRQNEWSCVSSYNVYCGPEQPFPILSLTISKKNLSAIAPDLVDDIIAGKNRIFVHGIGEGEYIVTKSSSSGQDYKVTAYSVFEQYKASPINREMLIGNWGEGEVYATPIDMISAILFDQTNYGTDKNRIFFNDSSVYYCFKSINNTWGSEKHKFSSSSDAWYVMSVAAAKLGCKIWFADNKVFIVDTSIDSYTGVTHNASFLDLDSLVLNTDGYHPENMSSEEVAFAQSVCGDTELGDEGADVLVNCNVVTSNSGANTSYNSYDNAPAVVQASRDKFGVRKKEYSIPEISMADASQIATNLDERYCDSEQSICFRLSEMHYTNEAARTGRYWQPYFPQMTRVNEIYDYSKDMILSNKPNFTKSGVPARLKNKLTLSTAQYFYPEGYTEYWFGIIAPSDFTQGTSTINNIIYNG